MSEILQIEGRTSSLGERLRLRRKLLNLSQEAVGVSIGLDESCSRVRISRYEAGIHEPNMATVKMLANALQVPAPYLYCERNSIAELILVMYQFSDSKIEMIIKELLSNNDDRLI